MTVFSPNKNVEIVCIHLVIKEQCFLYQLKTLSNIKHIKKNLT